MRTKIVRIGNSQGIRIPKPLLEESGLEGEVDLRVEDHSLVISPVREVRQGWDQAFATMAGRQDDALLDAEATAVSTWDETDWEWD
jgi:antitoxin MazE